MWDFRLQICLCFLWHFNRFQLGYSLAIKGKPTMIGEPLNPSDYENGFKLVISSAPSKNQSFDDGTYDDIRKKTIRENYYIVPWPNATIPYLLDEKFTTDDRALIAKAIQMIEANTCVRIISRTTEENHVLIRKNIYSTDCNSYIGVQGGKQLMNLAQRCVDRVGSTAHEFMHSLGFFHEQSRSDRDNYVIVRYENILQSAEHNFAKEEPPAGNFAGAYDTQSITHYSNIAFSKNGNHTLDALTGDGTVGQRIQLTQLDIEKLNTYYNCSRTKSGNSGSQSEEQISFHFNHNQTTNRGGTTCNDFDEYDCQEWASFGYCSKSPVFMSVYCKKTCNKCDMGCADMNKNCGRWALKYCSEYAHYMHFYCPYSCWIC